VTKPKDIGTRFTSDVIAYLRVNGFPQAELRNQAGEHDKGDIVGCLDIAIECKGGHKAETAGDGLVEAWLAETETERQNAGALIGILVMKRAAYGKANAGKWWAVMPGGQYTALTTHTMPHYWDQIVSPVRLHLASAVALLRAAGYGDPDA
jgi:hypothetical protein